MEVPADDNYGFGVAYSLPKNDDGYGVNDAGDGDRI